MEICKLFRHLARNLFSRPAPAFAAAPALARQVAARRQAAGYVPLGRDLSILHIAAGSCNGCELELRATQNLIYGLEQYGLRFTATPREADVLLITGVVNTNMREAVLQARAAMPDPVFVVALGDCAVDGGVFKGAPAVVGGAASLFPVDLVIAGCAPTPDQVIQGLLALVSGAD